MEKKEISAKTALKGLVNGFLAYGIMVIFIFFCIIVFVTWQIEQYKDSIDYDTLKYSIPILASFLIFFLVRGICRLSTFDLFKKCKIKKSDVETVAARMNLFFIGCVIFLVAFVLVVLNVRFDNQKNNIQTTSEYYYEQYGDESYANYKTVEMINDFQSSRATVLIQTTIIECGLILGLFSLISLQKKLINRYNYVEPDKENDDEEINHKKAGKGKHAAESV